MTPTPIRASALQLPGVDAAGPFSLRIGGTHLAVVAATAGREVDTHALSYRDEEIVIRSRAGELPHDIARALGHDLLDVMRGLNRALVVGIRTRP